MHVFLDESGDLGFRFGAPFRQGGSSRYLTIAYLLAPQASCKYPKRLSRDFKKQLGLAANQELKGTLLSDAELIEFATRTSAMCRSHPECQPKAITVKKRNVVAGISRDPNKLYNWMIRLSLLKAIENEPRVILTPDPRTIKVKSGNSMVDYLQMVLTFEMGSQTVLIEEPSESHQSLNLQFADVLCYTTWRHYELRKSKPFGILQAQLDRKELFFKQ